MMTSRFFLLLLAALPCLLLLSLLPHADAYKVVVKSDEAVDGAKVDKASAYQYNQIPALTVEPSARKEAVVNAMKHAWQGYKRFAWGKDELLPVSKTHREWFGVSLTMIDALDTLWIMGLKDEFDDAREWMVTNLSFDVNQDVNLFETTIRCLGGLLTTFYLTQDRFFLEKAIDLGDRLSHAWQHQSPIPCSDINLHTLRAHGPPHSPQVMSTAEATTIQLEFAYLSHVSGDMKYKELADGALKAVIDASDESGLVPIYINRNTKRFQGRTITFGARGDSYYEYLLKYWVMKGGKDDRLKDQYLRTMRGTIDKLIRKSEPSKLTFVGELINGRFSAKMDHLVCFLPGVLALGHLHRVELEDDKLLTLAKEIAYTCYQTYERTPTKLAPEITRFRTNAGASSDLYYEGSLHNLLRPETLESLFILSRVTGDPKYKEWGWNIFQAFEKHTKIPSGGYSNIANVMKIPVQHKDKMETFFLGETLKYAYLLMADVPGDESRNVIDLEKVVFNTEAHPFPITDFGV